MALTALAGYVTTATVINIAQALSLILSVALIAASATALNQVIERAVDSRMHRTRLRPLAQGRISCRSAVWLVCVLSLIGFTMLAQFNVESAFVAMAALAIYDFAYTPLKQISTVSLYVGAIPGALPPLVGSILAENRVSAHGVCLFAFMFLWQIPHFLAIGWIHRDDYRRAELHVLAAEDPGGFKSGSTALVTSTLLLAFIACAGGARLWAADRFDLRISGICDDDICPRAARHSQPHRRQKAVSCFQCVLADHTYSPDDRGGTSFLKT